MRSWVNWRTTSFSFELQSFHFVAQECIEFSGDPLRSFFIDISRVAKQLAAPLVSPPISKKWV